MNTLIMSSSDSLQKTLNPQAPEFIPYTDLKLLYLSSHHLYFLPPPPSLFIFQNPSFYYNDTTLVPYHPPLLPLYTNPSQPQVDQPQALSTRNSFERKPKRRVSWKNNNKNKYLINTKQTPFHSKKKHQVVPVEENGLETTLMIRNIPNRFTREMLINFLDDHCLKENQKTKHDKAAYDFVYLPIDFKSGANKGYAFVNFTNPESAYNFYLSAQNHAWADFRTNKICQIAIARLQGKKELIRHFESMIFPCVDGEYLPVCFSPARDGSKEIVKGRTVGRCTVTQVNKSWGD